MRPRPIAKRPRRVASVKPKQLSRFSRARTRTLAVLTWDGWLKLGAIAAAVGVLGGLWFTAHSFEFAGKQVEIANKQAGVAEQTEITTRFSKAVEQLGSQTVDVRLGGIYSLERLTRDSDPDRSTILDVLASFVRSHAPNGKSCTREESPRPSPDVQAALTVIGRRSVDTYPLDLSGACLRGASLMRANLRLTWFYLTDLTDAQLVAADLQDTTFIGSDLSNTHLEGANLGRARLAYSNLDGAKMAGLGVRRGEDFTRPTTLDDAYIEECHYDKDTAWPSGFPQPPQGLGSHKTG